MNKNPHELAGKTVKIKDSVKSIGGKEYLVEDYWHLVSGKSWMHSNGNQACLNYAIRSAFNGLPTDNEVLYGKMDGLGFLIHVSEIAN